MHKYNTNVFNGGGEFKKKKKIKEKKIILRLLNMLNVSYMYDVMYVGTVKMDNIVLLVLMGRSVS